MDHAHCLSNFDILSSQLDGKDLSMGSLTVRALRVVLVVVLAGTVFVQVGMVWALATGLGPETARMSLLRVSTLLGMMSVQVVLVCVWRLLTMARRGSVFSPA